MKIEEQIQAAIAQTVETIKSDPKATDETKALYSALRANEDIRKAFFGVMQGTAQKFAGIALAGGMDSANSAIEMMGNFSVVRPLLEMVLLGFQVGRLVEQATTMENMFNPEVTN